MHFFKVILKNRISYEEYLKMTGKTSNPNNVFYSVDEYVDQGDRQTVFEKASQRLSPLGGCLTIQPV